MLSKKTFLFLSILILFIIAAVIYFQSRNDPNYELPFEIAAPPPGAINAKDHGAYGDGKKDDTQAISEAISTANKLGGGTVYFDNGTYIVSKKINVPKNVSLYGANSENTTITRQDGEDQEIFSLSGNQTVQNLSIISNIGINILGDNISIHQTKFRCVLQAIQMFNKTSGLIIKQAEFTESGYGILSNNEASNNVRILDSKFHNILYDGIEINTPSDNWIIENCIFDNNISKSEWAGFGVGVAKKAKNITIKNSKFTNIIGQAVHVEDYAEVWVIGSVFENNGGVKYKGSPTADIAVLSNGVVTIKNSLFNESSADYSDLAIYNTDLPVGGHAYVTNSTFNNKRISKTVNHEQNNFLNE
ncbi:glycosyl hydrolase family 28-related protein [Niallia sp. FSL W8-1348]|uniref:glycosyl hydrolase family 28-related protein n=1 Tax=Niallia sp. FSL W8-1348 TaxID=2954656 RepID=UPI0030FA4987